MNIKSRFSTGGFKRSLAFVALAAFYPTILQACPICFTAPDSPETKGMTMAILFLLGTIGMVVCGVASFFMYLVLKEKNPSPDHQELAEIAFAGEIPAAAH